MEFMMFDKITLKENMSEDEFREIFDPDSEYNSWYNVFDDKPIDGVNVRIHRGYKLDIRNIKCEFVKPYKIGQLYNSHLKIDGSWSKFDSGENFTGYSILEFHKNYQKISNILGFDIKDMKITYIEYGLNVLLKNSVPEYLRLLIDHTDSRMKDSGFRDEETKSFENTQRVIKFYDKSKELIRDKYTNKDLKSSCKQNNFLRFEMRRKKDDIKKFIGENNTFIFLLDPDIWEFLLNDLRRIYNHDIIKRKEFDDNLLIKSGKEHTKVLMILGKQFLEDNKLSISYDESMSDSVVSKRNKVYRDLSRLDFGDTNPRIIELDKAINIGITEISTKLHVDISKYNYYPELHDIDSNSDLMLEVIDNENTLSLAIINTTSGEIEKTLYSLDSSEINLPDSIKAT